MKNEREINAFWRKKNNPDNDPKIRAGLDQFDLEAECEGGARRFFAANDLKPVLGRRIGKETRKSDGASKTAGFRANKNNVKDNEIAYKKYVQR